MVVPTRRIAAIGARAKALALRARVGANAIGESRRRRITWAIVALVLFAVPFAFNAAREARFTASVEIFPRPVPPYPAVSDPAYYRAFLEDPHLRGEMLQNANAGLAEYSGAEFRSTRRGTVLLAVSRTDPTRARELVEALGPQIAGATARQLAAQATQEAGLLRERIRDGRLDSDERRTLGVRLRRVTRLSRRLSIRVVLGPVAAPPEEESWADRVAAALPGETPERPDPLVAGIAGLFLAGTLWVIGLLLVPPVSAPATVSRSDRAAAG